MYDTKSLQVLENLCCYVVIGYINKIEKSFTSLGCALVPKSSYAAVCMLLGFFFRNGKYVLGAFLSLSIFYTNIRITSGF